MKGEMQTVQPNPVPATKNAVNMTEVSAAAVVVTGSLGWGIFKSWALWNAWYYAGGDIWVALKALAASGGLPLVGGALLVFNLAAGLKGRVTDADDSGRTQQSLLRWWSRLGLLGVAAAAGWGVFTGSWLTLGGAWVASEVFEWLGKIKPGTAAPPAITDKSNE